MYGAHSPDSLRGLVAGVTLGPGGRGWALQLVGVVGRGVGLVGWGHMHNTCSRCYCMEATMHVRKGSQGFIQKHFQGGGGQIRVLKIRWGSVTTRA